MAAAVALTLPDPALVFVVPLTAAVVLLVVFAVFTLVLPLAPPFALALIDVGPSSDGAESPEELHPRSSCNESMAQETWTDVMGRLLRTALRHGYTSRHAHVRPETGSTSSMTIFCAWVAAQPYCLATLVHLAATARHSTPCTRYSTGHEAREGPHHELS